MKMIPSTLLTSLTVMAERMGQSVPTDEVYMSHRAVVRRVETLRDALEGLEHMAWARDPMQTEAAHAQRVAKAAGLLKAKTEALENEIHGLVHEGTRSLSERIDARAGLVPNEFAVELRTAVRAMKPDEARAVLKAAVDAGDGAAVAALTACPAVLVGLDDQFRGRMAESFREKTAPAEHAALHSLIELYSLAAKAVSLPKAAAQAATDPKFITEIAAKQAAAADAQAKFEGALAPRQ